MKPEPPRIAPGKTHVAAARRLLHGARAATLATLLPDGGGPYASLVTMAVDHDASPILLLSGLADHTRNLRADARVSLLVDAARDLPNPQTGPRLTVIGRAVEVSDPDGRERLARRFLARHPGAALYAGFGDFAFWTVVVERAHFVGGFARAVWLDDGITRPAAEADAFAAVEPGAVAHMNADHADALGALAAAALGGGESGDWRMTALDAQGILLRNGDDDRVFHIPFDPALASPSEVRPRLVEMTRQARQTG
ncbi:HugZ family protein [Novispirillum sp. DQ9]|uniref:HugZ family pyridoxamine 5'-phosphate oxidase n=1 Tax=Novispirillum sp. DQ9 TaxID=3398612 RepID=UPI003C7E0ABD